MADFLKYFAVVTFIFLQNWPVFAKVRFDGHQVIRTFPASIDQVKRLQEFQLEGHVDFWTEPKLNGPTDILFTPSNNESMRDFLIKSGIRHEVYIGDVQKAIDKEDISQIRSSDDMDWSSYHGVNHIHRWLRRIVSQHKDIAQIINIGNSTEGRQLLVVRIGYPSSKDLPKKSYFADAGLHAREWIAPAVCTYFVNELLQNSSKYKDLLKEVDFYFLPVANPDGYEFSRKGNRLWRKTKSGSPPCIGVDPNRNYDFFFGGKGSSSRKCEDNYRGPRAFSEPETMAISQFILKRNANWRVYNAIHSYSQAIACPWGYTNKLPKDYNELKKLGDEAAAALKAVHGTDYDVGSVSEVLSLGAGGSDDWAKGHGGFKYSYTIELRDRGRYGFLLPADQIIPTAEETWEAVLVFANHIKNSQ